MKSAELKRRIIEISYRHSLSHLSSCLSAVEIIDSIYSRKARPDRFILSAGHAGLALYVVLEKYEQFDAEELLRRSGTHPSRKPFYGDQYQPFACSTGSLGMGLPVAAGLAYAQPDIDVYCLCSDGELFEGSCFEAYNAAHMLGLRNLHIYVNANGFGAYQAIHVKPLGRNMKVIDTSHIYREFPFLKGLAAHYHKMSHEDYEQAMERLPPLHLEMGAGGVR